MHLSIQHAVLQNQLETGPQADLARPQIAQTVQGNSPMEMARDQTISGDSNRGGAKQKREDAADCRWENLESAVGKGANQIRDRSGCDANVC